MSKKARHLIGLILVCAAMLATTPVIAQFTQQGPKLVGTGNIPSVQAVSVALSADGNTAAIVGGPIEPETIGGLWIWTRIAGVWTQQSPELIGSSVVSGFGEDGSVAISGDGNTALVGGPADDSLVGAAWVWTRSAGVWTQQGAKLVGSGAEGPAQQGASVALSADGNTAIVGGPADNSGVGAVWVFTRSGGIWSQQGTKLIASGTPRSQGGCVSLSSDGSTAIVGATSDLQPWMGWIWTRSGGIWTQQGDPLVGSDAQGPPILGFSTTVSISGDGNTAVVGGFTENNFVGAVWVWTRGGGIWTQQGGRLVPTDASLGPSGLQLGHGLSLSSDGNRLVIGGPGDNQNTGAIWVWARNGGIWSQLGAKLVGSGAVPIVGQGWSVSLSADGETAIAGGPADNHSHGAAWVFAKLPDLTVTKSHTAHFTQGDKGDTYTITVSNAGSAPTSGTVTVTDVVPTGLTPTAPNSTFAGWTCSINGQTLTCTQNDVLASGTSYPPITLLVDVANDANPSVTNTVTVAGGGEVNTANDSASDVTPIKAAFAPVTPIGVIANAVSSTQINVTWPAVSGAASYQIDRRAAGVGFVQIGTSVTNTFSDSTASADNSYLYRVRAVNEAGVSVSSIADLATTVIFIDNPLATGVIVKAVHLSQLRTAVNAVRLLAGLSSASFTDAATTGTLIQAVHVTEIRSALDEARGALGFGTGGYTDSTLTGVFVKAIHFQELCDRVQ